MDQRSTVCNAFMISLTCSITFLFAIVIILGTYHEFDPSRVLLAFFPFLFRHVLLPIPCVFSFSSSDNWNLLCTSLCLFFMLSLSFGHSLGHIIWHYYINTYFFILIIALFFHLNQHLSYFSWHDFYSCSKSKF